MANAILWQSAPVSLTEALGTHLNSLANVAYSTVGAAVTNSAAGNQYGMAVFNCTSTVTVGAAAYVQIFLVQSLDGTLFEDAPSSTNPGFHMLVATIGLNNTTALKRAISQPFRLPPGDYKVVLYNASGVALPGTGNTVTLFYDNDEVQ
jgi:hypothetical protein